MNVNQYKYQYSEDGKKHREVLKSQTGSRILSAVYKLNMEEAPNTMKILEGGTTFRQVCMQKFRSVWLLKRD